MQIGEALILKKEKGFNATFNKTIKEGEYFVEAKTSSGGWQEFKLMKESQRLIQKSQKTQKTTKKETNNDDKPLVSKSQSQKMNKQVKKNG